MIYFVPAWNKKIQSGMSTDDLMGQIQSFMSSNVDYKILISDYMPELRYFLHRYDLLESNYVSIFDELQTIKHVEQKSLTLKDLNFPDTATFSYTPFNILVYQEEALSGQITLGEASYISEVTYISGGKVTLVEIYDDRGFISSRDIYEDGNFCYKEYLNQQEHWVIRTYKDATCEVNEEYSAGLRQRYYESLEEIKFEKLESYYEQLGADDSIIVSLTEKNLPYFQKSKVLPKMTLSLFGNRLSSKTKTQKELEEVTGQCFAVIVDSNQNMQKVKEFTEESKIHRISPYDTRFELSRSHELKEEVIYFDSRDMTEEAIGQSIEILFSYLVDVFDNCEVERSFQIIIRMASYPLISAFSAKIRALFIEKFPEEMPLVEELLPMLTGENSIDATLLKKTNPEVKRVMQLWKSFELQIINSDDELFRIINETRLIIDLREEPDLFTQIAGISAGIPQINQVETEYVQAYKNGLVIADWTELYQGLSYYLDRLKHWQEARMFAVQQIKKYSGVALREKICQILGGINE
ncbi:accessory Sec system protein Asp1 [Lactococcus sp. DD01]|uniref:accessory Sec system protein Asp1 n=1 Tax=Lactococcus sp. DD01 TaxID=1776443 RepID=UPI000776AA1F|nr:accessory Sec system protein Asp1 [Lactococcus sp. DD01]KXT62831.1 Accessory secretory protein Asp1 [Lactococcus sp. DD01]